VSRLATAEIDTASGSRGQVPLREVLELLASSCAELTGAPLCSFVTVDESGDRATAASVGEAAVALDQLQLETHRGPTWECLESGRDVLAADLRRGATDATVSELAARSEVATAHAFALTDDDGESLGALTVYVPDGPPVAGDLPRAMAQVAAQAIVVDRSTRKWDEMSLQLSRAMTGRVWTERAKGILSEQLGIPPDEAFAILRSHARRTQRKVSDVAQDLVGGSLSVREVVAPPSTQSTSHKRGAGKAPGRPNTRPSS
jgi:GAF domain-containing protein